MKLKIDCGTADRVAANLTLSEWPGIVKMLPSCFPSLLWRPRQSKLALVGWISNRTHLSEISESYRIIELPPGNKQIFYTY